MGCSDVPWSAGPLRQKWRHVPRTVVARRLNPWICPAIVFVELRGTIYPCDTVFRRLLICEDDPIQLFLALCNSVTNFRALFVILIGNGYSMEDGIINYVKSILYRGNAIHRFLTQK